MKTTESIKVRIEHALREFFDPSYNNVWVSVKERSISSIFRNWNVPMNYSSSFFEVLSNKGFIERKGSKSQLEYKIICTCYPDAEVLADEIYKLAKSKEKKHKEFTGYPYSSSSDLQPKSKRVSKDSYSSAPSFIKREVPKLGDFYYILYDNLIYQARVVSVYYREELINNETKQRVFCDLELSKGGKVITSISQTRLHTSPESITKYLLAKVNKYK